MRMIDAEQVRAALSMAECIDVIADAMAAVSAGDAAMPARMFMPLVDDSAYFGVMSGSLAVPRVYGAKLVNFHPSNAAAGRPAIQGCVVLFDHDSGAPLAVVDGAAVTTLRTGAASGLATRLLARPDAATLGLFGYGVQAAAHLEAVCAVRDIEEVRIWGRSLEKARAFADQHAGAKLRVIAVENPREAAACDIVCTTTSSSEPVLLGAWIRPGTHINLVGAYTSTSREADSATIAAGCLYVDSISSALVEAGDILIPAAEGVIEPEHIIGEIGAVQSGRVAGRTNQDEITVYKSLGIVAQDLAAAHAAYLKMRSPR